MFVSLSVCPHGTTRLPLDGFPLNLLFEDFGEFCRENSSFVKTGQERKVLYTKTNIYFLIISCSFLLRMKNVADKICRENQNTHFVFSIFFFRKCFRLPDNTENFVERGRPQMTIWRVNIACWIPKATNTHTHVV